MTKSFADEFDDDEDELSHALNESDPPTTPEENRAALISSRYDLIPKVNYDFEAFLPVQEVTDDIKTTESDLAMLNNGMAVMDAALKNVTSVDSAKKIVESMIKLIECRRKVKKLQYGSGSVLLKAERGYEVLE